MAEAGYIFKTNFSLYMTTLKETSLDNHDNTKQPEYLCKNTTEQVYNFDNIVKDHYPTKQPSSFDALLIKGNNIYCIEFKNTKYSDVNNQEVQKKLSNSQDIIDDIFKKYNIKKSNYKFIFCVIYKNHEAKWRRGINKNIVQFDLEQYKGKYYDYIYTNDVQFFTHEYKKQFKKELAC